MNIWSRIRQLSVRQFIRLGLVFAARPMLIGPTISASKQTMKICNALFGGVHHKNGMANAFRHALWNILICRNSLKRAKNVEKSILWAEKVTFLYEKVTKNDILDQFMDLHNNELGRRWFYEVLDQNDENVIDFLQKKLKNAQKITKIENSAEIENRFIYISEVTHV